MAHLKNLRTSSNVYFATRLSRAVARSHKVSQRNLMSQALYSRAICAPSPRALVVPKRNLSLDLPLMQYIRLKKGKEKAVRQKHPWVFSGALENIQHKPDDGEIIAVTDHKDNFLAYGFYNGYSRVAVRLLEWDSGKEVNEGWWRSRIQNSVHARKDLLDSAETNACRIVFSEADYLPGLIVDRYADFLSVQILSAGIEKIRPVIIDELNKLLKPAGIFERSDPASREYEGMGVSSGILSGVLPPEFVTVKENNILFQVNIAEGQKSGFYCDQRENRRITAQYAENKRVLDCFCYSGGFTLNAIKHGAIEVVSVDSSEPAINTLKQNISINKMENFSHQAIHSDVNKALRSFRDAGEKFGLIILDPPKYAPSYSSLEKASRAYKDLNRQAMLLLENGGLLATFSCSGAVNMNVFKQILAWAALDAGKEIQFVNQFSQPADHPVRASFPESEYLKGLLCRVA
jgi:23S rRNA (cytosine1962-C5)-methyltransferase